ncbi:wsv098 [White spot syndrome virus]|uniref:Wsv098 n=5 Tax=White spot syndrome virus TaxID=342409 RepID=Q8VB85_WSSVS|nr:wsv098 [Shrimp white spot syndrome virus]AFX59475.1 wsv098 [White spot syndrome virus]AAL33102.1 wsv098 [Shrimp white spot syndrome virus]AAL89022.1 WSSV154 [Shrimp white spot syndrome virus]AWQ60286.1 wsv098 [Shrimp white spot syndrome virus]AWQ60701.1 wsv098 [Shrimp white spot syndrome virus]
MLLLLSILPPHSLLTINFLIHFNNNATNTITTPHPLHLCPRRPLHRLCGMMTMMMTKKTKKMSSKKSRTVPPFFRTWKLYLLVITMRTITREKKNVLDQTLICLVIQITCHQLLLPLSLLPLQQHHFLLLDPSWILIRMNVTKKEQQQHQHRLLPPLLLSLSGSLKLN